MKKGSLTALLMGLLLSFQLSCLTYAETLPVVRVAALKFGTVNWELDIIRSQQLDKKHGFQLEVVELISTHATAVSVQAGAADVMVTDWLWVAKQHQNGRYYRYFPFSTAVGDLLVPAGSNVTGLDDLADKELGVAGGSEGKSWLLFRAFTKATADYDLADRVNERFAAPPLINGLIKTDQLDAVLNYWHYSAALKAKGYRSLLTLQDVLQQLGFAEPVPMLGWVFRQQWAEQQPQVINAFLSASYEAKKLLLESDEQWLQLKPRMKAEDQALFEELRQGYRQGVPQQFSESDMEAIARVYDIVTAELSPAQAQQQSGSLGMAQEIFWRQFTLDNQ